MSLSLFAGKGSQDITPIVEGAPVESSTVLRSGVFHRRENSALLDLNVPNLSNPLIWACQASNDCASMPYMHKVYLSVRAAEKKYRNLGISSIHSFVAYNVDSSAFKKVSRFSDVNGGYLLDRQASSQELHDLRANDVAHDFILLVKNKSKCTSAINSGFLSSGLADFNYGPSLLTDRRWHEGNGSNKTNNHTKSTLRLFGLRVLERNIGSNPANMNVDAPDVLLLDENSTCNNPLN